MSIPAYALARGEHRVTTFRMIRELHMKDRAEGRGGWLISHGPRRKLHINVSFLRREHPELFEVRVRTTHDIDCLVDSVSELVNRIEDLESTQADEIAKRKAVGASVRAVRSELSALQSVAGRCAKAG